MGCDRKSSGLQSERQSFPLPAVYAMTLIRLFTSLNKQREEQEGTTGPVLSGVGWGDITGKVIFE